MEIYKRPDEKKFLTWRKFVNDRSEICKQVDEN